MSAASDNGLRLALGLQSHAELHGSSARGLVRLGRHAEQVGLHGVLIGDHVVIGPRLDRYPYPPVHFDADAPWMEPLTVLAAVAAVTERITVATGVIVSPLRPAVLLAKTVATLDAIAEGRVELGVGVGWQPEEFDAVGADFDARGTLLTDGIGACRTLWSSSPAEFHSSTVSFTGLHCTPKPPRGDVPVLFSGSLHARNLHRITTLGAGWITHPGQPLVEVAEGTRTLRAAFEAVGRDPAELRVRTRLPVVHDGAGRVDVTATLDAVDDYARAGVTDLTLWSNTITRDGAALPDELERIGGQWRAAR